jgi:ankyrin repeat protein/uncharacterized membrane protein YgcG
VAAALIITALGVWAHQLGFAPWSTRRVQDETRVIRVHDEARVLPSQDVPRFEGYLKWIFEESDIDVRLVILKGLQGVPIENATIDWMERLGIGMKGREERGVLILYDLAGQRLRVEIGYGLEGYLPDAFISYLMNDHARLFFASGDVSTGLQLMIRILQMRIRQAVLGEQFDPTVLEAVRRNAPLSGGGGASAAMAIRRGSASYKRSAFGPKERSRYVAQENPEQTYSRYLEWMAAGRFDPTVELFTPKSREYLQGLLMSKAYFDYILMGEHGKRFTTDIRGDLALLYFTNDPFISPHFFRRRDNRWYMDICAEVENTVERVGGVYTWDYRGRDDDFTRTFSDKLVNLQGYIRIAGGDNRELPTRGSASKSSETAGWTKLHFAAADGRTEEVRRILDHSKEVDVRNAKGRTPLYEASKRGRLDVVKLLIERGATINTKESDFSFTPLHVASERKHADIVRYLIGKGAVVDVRNKWEQTPLWQAAWQTWHQDSEVVEILLQNGADPNAWDHQGVTPLHIAASMGNTPVVALLLRKGADANSRTVKGSTPLHIAAGGDGDYLEIIRLLLDNRADINATVEGLTPLRIAEKRGHEQVITLLRERGAK